VRKLFGIGDCFTVVRPGPWRRPILFKEYITVVSLKCTCSLCCKLLREIAVLSGMRRDVVMVMFKHAGGLVAIRKHGGNCRSESSAQFDCRRDSVVVSSETVGNALRSRISSCATYHTSRRAIPQYRRIDLIYVVAGYKLLPHLVVVWPRVLVRPDA
jgi:hypothetical protein